MVAVVLIATVLSAASGHASAPSRIVFTADQAPSLSGEIYRLDPDGTLVNLTSSPFQESGPVVSPDGRRVAFFSDRSGELSVWESGIDGSDPVQVGPSFGTYSTWQMDYSIGDAHTSSLAWQPGGDRLAAAPWHTLFFVQPGQEPVTAFTVPDTDLLILGPWSPDGKVLVVWDENGDVARAFSPDGSQLWSVPHVESPIWGSWSGEPPSWSWSRSGLLALPVGVGSNPRLRVYDESGKVRFTVHGRISGNAGWSPDGKHLAVVVGKHAEVFTATGRRILRTRSGISSPYCRQVIWANNKRFIVGAFVQGAPRRCGEFSVAVRTGKVSTTSRWWFGTVSADRKLAAVAAKIGNEIAIGVRSTAGGAATTYARVPQCAPNFWREIVGSLQFAGPTHSLVYTTYCPSPPVTLYSVAPDGSGLQELASSSAYPFQRPALSPDGIRIAISNGFVISILDSGGGGVQLTDPPTACNGLAGDKIPYRDISPSWSPDETEIVFTRTDCDGRGELYTVATAGGGVGRDLGLAGDQAAWGPAKIAYVAQKFGEPKGVWTANPDGTDPAEVDPSGRDPAWSPAGRLAYLTGSNTVVADSAPVQLPFIDVTSLAWSPDGSRFVVTARTAAAAPFDVYTVNTDGSDPVQLTQNYDALDLAGWR